MAKKSKVLDKKNDDESDDNGKKNDDDMFIDPTMVCNHPNWTHENEPNQFADACSYLCLCMDPDDAEDYVDELQQASDKGKIEHYKSQDILRAAKLPLLPADDADVAKHIAEMKTKKLHPILLIRGEGKKHLTIADGYHRTCAGYWDDEDNTIPCVVINP